MDKEVYKPLEKEFSAQWIWAEDISENHKPNTWMIFRKKINLKEKPQKPVTAWIAADSKYWLYVNGSLIVFDGQLKRGPSPTDTYVDVIELSDYLNEGENTIAVLVDYFGVRTWSPDGEEVRSYSNNDSGKGAFLFEAYIGNELFISDKTWKVKKHPGYLEPVTAPNYRIPETDLNYSAKFAEKVQGWQEAEFDDTSWAYAVEMGRPPVSPWNQLWKRPIPQWKDSGIIRLTPDDASITKTTDGQATKYVLHLPTNLHSTAYLKINAPVEGEIIKIRTSSNKILEASQAQYITKKGLQEYESLLWLTGWEIYVEVPNDIEILELGYRLTGYNTSFSGSFRSDDEWLNRLWIKSRDTLYVTMRDGFMDCPDRERALWWGDAVFESQMAYYSLDTESYKLIRKGISNVKEWSRNGIRITVPLCKEWFELPAQSLAGIVGDYMYYMYTGDKTALEEMYGLNMEYLLKAFHMNEEGLVDHREGSWDWADWGEEVDLYLLTNTWYYLAARTMLESAAVLGTEKTAEEIRIRKDSIAKHYDEIFWTGKEYRSPQLIVTDDRANALAVHAGLVSEDKYFCIREVLKTQKYASPYMEKYVLEAQCMMGFETDAIERMKERYSEMLETGTPTLWELFPYGGSANHAWSGGPLVIMSGYFAGVMPAAPGYEIFEVKPLIGNLQQIHAVVPTIRGEICVQISVNSQSYYDMEVTVPEETEAEIYLPIWSKAPVSVKINGQERLENTACTALPAVHKQEREFLKYRVKSGKWNFEVKA